MKTTGSTAYNYHLNIDKPTNDLDMITTNYLEFEHYAQENNLIIDRVINRAYGYANGKEVEVFLETKMNGLSMQFENNNHGYVELQTLLNMYTVNLLSEIKRGVKKRTVRVEKIQTICEMLDVSMYEQIINIDKTYMLNYNTYLLNAIN